MKKTLLALVLGTAGLLGAQAALAHPASPEAPPNHRPVPMKNLAGGWSTQAIDDSMKAAAAEAATLLAGPDWLGRPVEVKAVDRAMTQVVAGRNVYLAMKAQVNGKLRAIEVVVYQPLKGPATITWMRMEAEGR